MTRAEWPEFRRLIVVEFAAMWCDLWGGRRG